MNDAHTHLLINHFPIIGLIIGTLILLAGILFKSSTVKIVALFVLLLSAGFAIPASSTGEGAEEVVEHMGNMTEETHHLIHEHEEKAELFMPFAWGILGLSLIILFLEWKKKKIAIYFNIVLLLLTLTASYLVRQVGTSGGEIAHPEIRKGFVPQGEDDDEH